MLCKITRFFGQLGIQWLTFGPARDAKEGHLNQPYVFIQGVSFQARKAYRPSGPGNTPFLLAAKMAETVAGLAPGGRAASV